MRVHILVADQGGSAYYRVEEPARVARELGVEVEVSRSVKVDAVKYAKTGLTEIKELDMDCDVLVIQRPLRQTMAETARVAASMGIAVVIELDDDFWTVSPYNMAARAVDPAYDPMHNYMWLDEALQHAHMATVSSTALLKAHPQSIAVRNYVTRDTEKIRREERDGRVIGWTGTVATHPHDLQTTNGALRGRELYVAGDPKGVKEATGVTKVTSNDEWISSVYDFWRVVGEQIDIGIVPLEPTAFNESKSWNKGMEFAALGIPFVASPTREYVGLEARGAGILAKSRSQWANALDRLISDQRYYDRIRSNGYRAMEQLYLEDHAYEWVQAWEKAARLAGRKV